MLATLGGLLALLLGLLLLLLPLLASELSRARDSVWGAVVLLLGLVLVTSAERLTGAPMLAVLCGGLLIGRLGVEVGQARWRLLSEEERQRLWSWERWQTSLSQLGASLAQLLQQAAALASGLGSWV
ncbi:Ycf66 family protein, partial [Synechococcus sp. BA-120 BA3]|nr:Ycf66 family protein [Synechococcus sp. BA-120 BA3]